MPITASPQILAKPGLGTYISKYVKLYIKFCNSTKAYRILGIV
jgi:hypothetical protein